jgi:RHS repeat-associated protein
MGATDAYGNTIIFDAAGTGGNWWADNASVTNNPVNPYIFTGRQYDPESQIYYYRARYYQPQLGRFVSRDPLYNMALNHDEESGLIYVRNRYTQPVLGRWMGRDNEGGYIDGMSLYEYVAGRPTISRDPDGLRCQPLDATDGSCPVPWTAQPTHGVIWQYGCYCGLGQAPGRPKPIDDFDLCCQKHDDCYTPPPGGPPLTPAQIKACDLALCRCIQMAQCLSLKCQAQETEACAWFCPNGICEGN